MAERQRIDRVRRQYNQWVADETLEDYALRFTATRARRWSAYRVANTALGAISFLALEAIGATITLKYGVTNASLAILAVSLIIFLTSLPICWYAAKYGVDIDLLTRGAGFGYIGSTITSLIYASFTFIFFAIEAVILSTALELCFGLPQAAGYLVSVFLVIPIVAHGITLMSRFQLWTQPPWLILQILPFAAILFCNASSFHDWRGFAGLYHAPETFDIQMFGAAAAVVFALIAQIGEQVDFLRFLPATQGRPPFKRILSLLAAGPGWIVIGALKLFAGSFLAFFALKQGIDPGHAGEPAHMYLAAFRYFTGNTEIAILLTGIFVILSQLKINITNAYAGSIAWSNFFSRATHNHPGRVVWLVFNVVLALLLMELDVYRSLDQVLALYSNIAIAWIGALTADLVVNKPLGLSPPYIEFKRAHLYDFNPVGVGAMLFATCVSLTSFVGVFGATVRALSPFIALASAFAAAPLIAYLTGGRFYLARRGRKGWNVRASIECSICENSFEPQDMAYCPAYCGPICSLCCSLDARCDDLCKKNAGVTGQIACLLKWALPRHLLPGVQSRIAHYLGVFTLSLTFIAAALVLIGLQAAIGDEAETVPTGTLLWKVFFIFGIVAGVAAWIYVLAEESRRAAQEESHRQTRLLLQEIEAHKRTDKKLQQAKEVAEAANFAKSRYVVGLSHELRTPLNAVLGYAQLLEQDEGIPKRRRDQIRVVRSSAEHLSGLIDGLLDVSKIEAGRIHINRDEVRIAEFLDHIVSIFRLQAAAKGIEFIFEPPERLPLAIRADEKRLRQILINLLSNALKFTDRGHILFKMTYRSPMAEFEISDTGTGIPAGDLKRIFEPFERCATPGHPRKPGTGLGLTICKLLTGVMGGEIKVTSTYGAGSTFRVKLVMSEASPSCAIMPAESRIYGYTGDRRTILVTDDDPAHRDLVREILVPRGFILLSAPDAPDCLELIEHCKPDLFLLDVSLPSMSGFDLASRIQNRGHGGAAFLMISASGIDSAGNNVRPTRYDDFLLKPINIRQFLDKLQVLLSLRWTYEPGEAAATRPTVHDQLQIALPPRRDLDDLRHLGEIGYVRGIEAKLDEIEARHTQYGAFVDDMRQIIEHLDFGTYIARLTAGLDHDA